MSGVAVFSSQRAEMKGPVKAGGHEAVPTALGSFLSFLSAIKGCLSPSDEGSTKTKREPGHSRDVSLHKPACPCCVKPSPYI